MYDPPLPRCREMATVFDVCVMLSGANPTSGPLEGGRPVLSRGGGRHVLSRGVRLQPDLSSPHGIVRRPTMDIQVSLIDRIPVLALSGRFDGFGALQFDEAAQGVSSEARSEERRVGREWESEGSRDAAR